MTRSLALLACLVALLLVPRPSAAGHLMLSANDGKYENVDGVYKVADPAPGRRLHPDGKYVVVQNHVEQELAMYHMTPPALEDTGVRIKVKGHPASLRVAPQ